MRRFGAFILLLGLAAPALAADPPAEEAPSVPWYRWLFLGERAKPAPRSVAGKAGAIPASRDRGPSRAEDTAKAIAEENELYLRRLEAITKIKRIANEQGDDEMEKRAEDLERQAEAIHEQRIARLTGQRSGDDRAKLEAGRDTRPATAEKPSSRRRPTRGGDR